MVIIGAGVVGSNAVQMTVGMGARVTVPDRSIDQLRQIDLVYDNRITTQSSSTQAIEDAVVDADLAIGSVLIPGGGVAPNLVGRSMIAG